MPVKGPKESEIQKAFFQWLSYYPYIRALTTHIPNGGSRHKLEAVNLKKQGVTAGWPDIFIAIASNDYHGLWIELKSKGSGLSPAQKYIKTLLSQENYDYYVCDTLQAAMEAVKTYLGDKFHVKQRTVSGKDSSAGSQGSWTL
jgi:hypothetical protein